MRTSQQQQQHQQQQHQPEDWQVCITIHGIAGLDLVPVSSMTEFAPLVSISESSSSFSSSSSPSKQQKNDAKSWSPMVSIATHRCQWDSMIHIPLRWRDLPRDAYLKFQVTGSNGSVVRRIPMLFALALVS
jgi:hypothetical protein